MTAHSVKNKHQIVIYLQVRQPRRLRIFQYLDTGGHKGYFDEELNEMVVKRVSQDCYIPVNEMLLKLIFANPEVRICLSITGETIDLLEKYSPEALESFIRLASTGAVEFFGETYYHSLSSSLGAEEFQAQSVLHSESIYRHFGLRPTVFRNTELIYSDDIGSLVAGMGFKGVICEGAAKVVDGKDPDQVYKHPDVDLSILARNVSLSDQISLRFGAGNTALTVDKFILSLDEIYVENAVTLYGFNYEIFADHLNRDAGMVEFFGAMLSALAHNSKYKLRTASEVFASASSRPILSMPKITSWSDGNKNMVNFLGNDMQQEAFGVLSAQTEKIYQVADETVLGAWRSLQSSDHFYYMATGKLKTGHYPDLYTPYPSPYEAFINYMNAVNVFSLNLQTSPVKEPDDEHAKALECERQHPRIPMWAMQKEYHQGKAPELNV
ncbi:MAG: alpha-amylase [Chryseolinea sp.]